ncbi:hypothetical protein N7532_001691 [Penicillium argentinense]|uniref:Uncharacterized protein n=1 Tax=Penicillium argentinense TaxID=1131581 RepID=A0A9W9G376_9EURO|nr:uncharacterized protein N7532_001691 [Penicillium argentinense]KAJ5111156.1 hypothetical protein N7532_001691 [Penicillium argentinense]
MKSFAVAALLASTAMALPTNVIPSGTIPSGVPSCIPSGVVPSGVPLPSGIEICLPSATPSASASSIVSKTMTVTNQNSEQIPVQLQSTVANALSSVEGPIGQVVQTAPSVGALNLENLGSGFMTVATKEGSVALVKLTSTAEGLLSSLGLGQVSSLVGTLVGTVEGTVESIVGGLGGLGGLKRDAVSDVMQITNLNGDVVPVKLESSVLGLLSGLDLTSLLGGASGPIGSVVAVAPSVTDLASKAQSIAADPTQLIGVLSQDGSSAMLVKLEGTATGLLSSLGLSTVGTTVGSVVGGVAGNAL